MITVVKLNNGKQIVKTYDRLSPEETLDQLVDRAAKDMQESYDILTGKKEAEMQDLCTGSKDLCNEVNVYPHIRNTKRKKVNDDEYRQSPKRQQRSLF